MSSSPRTGTFEPSGLSEDPRIAPGVVAAPAPVPSVLRFTPISATILTKDSASRLDEVLSALHWCDEVVVLDTGSTDDTVAIARRHPNVRVHHLDGPFPGFGSARRRAVALARYDWILSIDSDEVVTPELGAEIGALQLDPRTVYSMPFENHFNGRRIARCGWSPDRHERLFNRRATSFCESQVHERVQTARLAVRKLHHPVRHYSYESLDDFLRKMTSYARLFATRNAGRRTASPAKAVARSLWAFFQAYVLQLGCLEGYEGLVISASRSQSVFWKYLMLYEANRRHT
jgi:glycosyltransferase involved in cell wall biosynthesis